MKKKEVIIPLTLGMRGFMKYESVHPETGKRTLLADWHPNTILDVGRNEMGTRSNWLTACQVGTDNTLPTAAQTQLLGYVAGTATITNTTFGAQALSPYYQWKRTTFRFGLGSGVGGQNLSESGIGWSVSSGPFLISRALIRDQFGVPQTITPLVDEYLDVTYELRYYPPLGDTTDTLVLDGVTYNVTTRASSVTSGGEFIGQKIGVRTGFASYFNAFDGEIGAITSAPSGVSAAPDNTSQFDRAYSNNSYRQDMQCDCGISGWNLGAGIRSVICSTKAFTIQSRFGAQGTDNTIPKSASYTMSLVWRISWAEAGPIFSGTITTQNWSNGVPASLDISTYFQSDLPEPITYTVVAGSLPSGLSLNSSTGLIDGTPDTVSSGTLQVQCTNEVGTDTTNLFSWAVS